MTRFTLLRIFAALSMTAGGILAQAQSHAGYLQQVQRTSVTLSLASVRNPSNIGDGTAAVLQVTGPGLLPPTGVITFTAIQNGQIIVGLGAIPPMTLDSAGKANWTFNLPPGTYQFLAAYSGDAEYAPSDAIPITQTVLGPADFIFSLDPGPLVVKQGATWTGTLKATSYNNFQGNVTVSCDGGGSAVLMACSPGQPLLVSPAGATRFPVQITTTITTLKILSGAGLFVFGIGFTSKKRRGFLQLRILALLPLVLWLAGCGAVRYQQSDGTPKGDYKITFVGQSGSLSHAVSLVVTVQ